MNQRYSLVLFTALFLSILCPLSLYAASDTPAPAGSAEAYAATEGIGYYDSDSASEPDHFPDESSSHPYNPISGAGAHATRPEHTGTDNGSGEASGSHADDTTTRKATKLIKATARAPQADNGCCQCFKAFTPCLTALLKKMKRTSQVTPTDEKYHIPDEFKPFYAIYAPSKTERVRSVFIITDPIFTQINNYCKGLMPLFISEENGPFKIYTTTTNSDLCSNIIGQYNSEQGLGRSEEVLFSGKLKNVSCFLPQELDSYIEDEIERREGTSEEKPYHEILIELISTDSPGTGEHK